MSPNATMTRSPATEAMEEARLSRRRSRRRLLVRLLVGLLVVAVLAGVGWLVGFSSLLAARQVAVSGAGMLDPGQVRTVAQVPLGLPLARQDVDGIARRVATLRPVQTVHVSREWPHTIKITVVERTALLAVRQPDGLLLIDPTGTGFATVGAVPEGVLLAEVNPDNAPLLTDVGVVATAMPTQFKRKVAKITALSADAIDVVLRNGDVVVWGSADDSVLKAKVASALVKRSATTYDVSAPRSPTTR